MTKRLPELQALVDDLDEEMFRVLSEESGEISECIRIIKRIKVFIEKKEEELRDERERIIIKKLSRAHTKAVALNTKFVNKIQKSLYEKGTSPINLK